MIVLSRPDGSRLALNADQIERIDEAPHTLVTLVNGNAYVVAEALEEVVDRVTAYQARIRAGRERLPRSRPRSTARPAHLTLAGDPATPPPGAPAPDAPQD